MHAISNQDALQCAVANYAIDPDSLWVKTAGPRNYAMSNGQTQLVGLPVVKRDGVLTGTVTLPDGSPARGSLVIAEGLSRDIEGLTLRALIGDNGRFAMLVPAGLYNVRAAMLHTPNNINPAAKGVNVPRLGSASVALQYRLPNASIVGTVSGGSAPNGPVSIWAWSTDDGYNTTVAQVGGTYTLPVIAGQTWNVVAIAENRISYWIARAAVAVPTPGMVNQNLPLVGPKPKPAPVTVMFDPSQDQFIELADGTRIHIPAGAMPTTQNVILHITPLAAVPHHRNGNVLGFSYAFEAFTADGQPITQNFNQDVIITFKYDLAEVLAAGLNVNRLRPAYFSTTTDSWTIPDSYVVDESAREITMEINHFTEMSIVGIEQYGNQTFLPLLMK